MDGDVQDVGEDDRAAHGDAPCGDDVVDSTNHQP